VLRRPATGKASTQDRSETLGNNAAISPMKQSRLINLWPGDAQLHNEEVCSDSIETLFDDHILRRKHSWGSRAQNPKVMPSQQTGFAAPLTLISTGKAR
jgi:hypothetical protein